MRKCSSIWKFGILALALALFLGADAPKKDSFSLIGESPSKELTESSGIAISRANEGCFWTHNDSGDTARIFLLGPKAEDRGTFSVEDAAARDWEDICSFELEGKRWLLIADVGDNAQARSHGTLYLVQEPKVDDDKGGTLKVDRKIDITWPGGAMNCESVAFDVATSTIYLVTKEPKAGCTVYSLPMPATSTKSPVALEKVAALTIPMTSAMDMSADGKRCIILCYQVAYEWVREKDEKWSDAFQRKPEKIALPKRKQGEGICYGSDGKTLYLTSEGKPCPLWKVAR